MQLYEYDGLGVLVDSFEADPRDIVGSWLQHSNKRINQMVRQITAECILDYWSKKDPYYVNHMAPMMCYVECEHHGPQIGDRSDYPHPGTSPEGMCPECREDLMYAIHTRAITVSQISTAGSQGTLSKEEVAQIISRCRDERANQKSSS